VNLSSLFLIKFQALRELKLNALDTQLDVYEEEAHFDEDEMSEKYASLNVNTRLELFSNLKINFC
jgi:hypothetical protein